MNTLSLLRITGFLEGISYLLLFLVTMPLKYYFGMPEPNMIMGMAHGFLFLLYIVLVVVVKFEKNWPAGITFWALVASLLPFGTFVADRKIFTVEQR